ncbi:MAG: phosphoglycolate phosphatase [Gammaproteobacteria bacterium]|nr:phosphoglycolate phosphatase [Gammaproteobacteria bacterium]
MKLKKPKLVLFDLDGTMVDSVPDLAFSLDATLEKLGLPERGVDAARCWVGNGIERLVKRGLTNHMTEEPDPELFSKAIAIFRDVYADNASRLSRVYPGVEEGLQYLQAQGIHRACVTNKAERFTGPLLEALGLAPYLEIVISGDTLPKNKPDPMPLLHVAKHFGIACADCVMVGDSRHDIAAARAAGFQAVAVPYGYNHGDDIADAGPDVIIQSIADLAGLFTEDQAC